MVYWNRFFIQRRIKSKTFILSFFAGLKVGAGGNKLVASQSPPQHAKGQIKAVTGATISSKAVCDIINKTVGEVQKKLATAAKGG